MTLYINARFLTQAISGVQRYAHELLRAMDEILADDSSLCAEVGPVVALAPDGVVWPNWQVIKSRTVPGRAGHLWEQTHLLRASRDGVLISLGNGGPLGHPRQVLTLHDANIYEIPQAFSPCYRMLHKALRPALARQAAGLVTVSHFSAQALGRHLGIDPARFEIIPNSAAHILRQLPHPHVLRLLGLRKGGYLLSVGNQSPNKNISHLIAEHQMAGSDVPPLVIAGGVPRSLVPAAVHDRERVRCLGRVEDTVLRALYDGAAGFVFPSLYEGFGIPPLEAMQLGIPVLAARRAVMPEVLGDAPIWFDPERKGDLAAALVSFSTSTEAQRNALSLAGLERAGLFSWTGSAQTLLSVARRAGSQSDALDPAELRPASGT